MDKINENGQSSGVIACLAVPKFFAKFHELQVNPKPPDPDPQPSGNNYLGSPYGASFTVTQIYDPPNHNGIDMVGLTNKNIYATVSGVVVDSRWENENDHSQGYGQLIRIKDNATGLYFIYGHLSERDVSEGETVTKGQKIGVEGNTGYSTGSHCHYQVSEGWNNGVKNPANYGEFKNQLGVQ